MSRYRIEPCVNYVCKGNCSKGRIADHRGYCQKCNLYEPRVRLKHKNLKKEKILNNLVRNPISFS